MNKLCSICNMYIRSNVPSLTVTNHNADSYFFHRPCANEILRQHVMDFHARDAHTTELETRLTEHGIALDEIVVYDKGIVHDLKSTYPHNDNKKKEEK